MALLGKAALAMWWDMAAHARADFEHWHAHEHFPERLGIPGFRRASRWRGADGGAGVFVLYELEDRAVLSSAAYLARLNAPTPWSTRLMPEHRHMVRSQCHVLESRGGGVARHALTLRLSPAAGQDEALRTHVKALAATLAMRPGLVGAHLLRHEAPPIAPTREQQIRGSADQVADWVVVVCGYNQTALQAVATTDLAEDALLRHGAAPGQVRGLYTVAYSATPGDVAGP